MMHWSIFLPVINVDANDSKIYFMKAFHVHFMKSLNMFNPYDDNVLLQFKVILSLYLFIQSYILGKFLFVFFTI